MENLFNPGKGRTTTYSRKHLEGRKEFIPEGTFAHREALRHEATLRFPQEKKKRNKSRNPIFWKKEPSFWPVENEGSIKTTIKQLGLPSQPGTSGSEGRVIGIIFTEKARNSRLIGGGAINARGEAGKGAQKNVARGEQAAEKTEWAKKEFRKGEKNPRFPIEEKKSVGRKKSSRIFVLKSREFHRKKKKKPPVSL